MRRSLSAVVATLLLGIALVLLNSPDGVKEPVSQPVVSPQSTSAQLAPTNTLLSVGVLKVEQPKVFVLVKRVVDGDTIQIETGEKVRYIGINTPESVDPRRSVQCFGKAAFEYNKNLVAGKLIRLVKDISETDRYGRLLRYVYLEDGTFVNLKLVEEGYAYAATFPPDVKYSLVFVESARKAREAGRGLWSECR